MTLILADGSRKYLTGAERERVQAACMSVGREHRAFSLMLYHTGCRISEALNLKRSNIDFGTGHVVFETLKRRKKGTVRAVPLPEEYLRSLDDVYDLRSGKDLHLPIWSYSRTTGWRIIIQVMSEAGLEGLQASPKGLRHGFAIACIEKNIPLNMIKKWMGDAS